MGAPLIAATVVVSAFILIGFEATFAVRRQQAIEHYNRLLARADRVRTARLAARRAAIKNQIAHKEANNLHTIQYHAGDDSPATDLAAKRWIEAAWNAPTTDTTPEGSLR